MKSGTITLLMLLPLTELTSGTWQPRAPQEQAIEADFQRHQQDP